MNKEYVQQYVQLEKGHWWFVVRQKIILQFLKKYLAGANLKILNIGAAGGASTLWLSTFGKVISVETDSFFLEHLTEQNIEVVNASVTQMPFNDEEFDLVCAFDVIEHVADDTAAISEIERVCKKGGTICMTVPAFKMLWSNHDVVNGHYRRYTKKDLQELSEKPLVLEKICINYFNSLLFVPILIARKISNFTRGSQKSQQSDFTSFKTVALVNKIFKFIFSLELTLLNKLHFPFGVSLIGIWKKTGKNIPRAK
ncbi:MAG: class I SAM-dependent methyltransferase [Gloeobacteraceae cyanobacterium ES-bin-316]|nr:class I SAM-dependent methyltransferase [Ferruginibacter sp.]